jgi:hypothetical protein
MTAIAVSATSRVYRNSASARLIERTTTASVALLAGIAALVSYGHMHALAMQHGEGRLASALIPLSVDGMIVASSMSLLLDSRLGRRGGVLPWTLLIIGAAASLAANIAVAEPTLLGRVIAAWPSFALTASYELLMRQVRHAAHRVALAAGEAVLPVRAECAEPLAMQGQLPAPGQVGAGHGAVPAEPAPGGERRAVQRRAWQWALINRRPDGSLPAGSQVARQFGRSDRWGRLVTGLGRAGQLSPAAETIVGSGRLRAIARRWTCGVLSR